MCPGLLSTYLACAIPTVYDEAVVLGSCLSSPFCIHPAVKLLAIVRIIHRSSCGLKFTDGEPNRDVPGLRSQNPVVRTRLGLRLTRKFLSLYGSYSVACRHHGGHYYSAVHPSLKASKHSAGMSLTVPRNNSDVIKHGNRRRHVSLWLDSYRDRLPLIRQIYGCCRGGRPSLS
ncbi:hypothetical protein DAEQUDRAFT_210574 [Daedalea quercina L-15889]|uniref:Uncharacterized protein n=1 Tax=Daedalea quercina L-15889 TaxID=1314783 RepID=A0A165RAN0_9APHY|nr:hypothetical protein DAEQUDRAFT_210574 [Daedalea quercina L-15889]